MKASAKIYIFLAIAISAVLGLIIVNVFGVYKVFVLGKSYTVFEFIAGFFATIGFLLIGVAFWGYEGRGTPMNMTINGIFYFLLIVAIVFIVLFFRQRLKK